MKIKSMHIENIKTLHGFNIKFNDNVNVLTGGNGVGKTTILETIYNIITANRSFIKDKNTEGCCLRISFTKEEVALVSKDPNKSSKEALDIEETVFVSENNIIKSSDIKYTNTLAKLSGCFKKVIYLPTDVNFKKHKVKTAKKLKDITDIGVILNSDEMSLNLKEYLVNIHYKDLEDMSMGETQYRIEKFKKLYNAFFEEKEFLGVKDFEPLFKIKATGEIHSADELSSGEKQIFYRGGSLLQLDLNNSIILIDEPELSLHPEWQQKILDFYKSIGENNQIIIATHSPHIVSSCKKEEVILLDKKDGKTIIKDNIEETYGWTVEQLLLTVFKLRSVRNLEMQEKLDRFKSLYINKENLKNNELMIFNELKSELEKYLDPEDPSLSLINIKEDSKKLKALLKSLKSNHA